MDPIVGVWLSSLVGAGAFAAAGYVLGQRGVVIPLLGLEGDGATAPRAAPRDEPAPPPAELTPAAPVVATATNGTPLPPEVTGPPPPLTSSPPAVIAIVTPTAPVVSTALPPTLAPTPSPFDAPTFVPTPPAAEAEERATVAPAAPASERSARSLAEALERAEAEALRARTAEALRAELERQLEALRAELRRELMARATAESRLEEMGDRLARASEETASLRHKVSRLDAQARQLRDSLQGRVRALTESERHRRRELEETEDVRQKLKDAYERIERSSIPPGPASRPPPSVAPRSRDSFAPPSSPVSPFTTDDVTVLREEIIRLTTENRSLRARAIGAFPPKRSRGSAPDLDLDVYRTLVERVGALDGLRGAAITDELGSLLVGAGDHTESLAAFGAYIRDASSRTDRLLPLDGVDEVEIRDRAGARLTTRIVTRAPAELALVVLGAAEPAIAAARRLVDETLPR